MPSDSAFDLVVRRIVSAALLVLACVEPRPARAQEGVLQEVVQGEDFRVFDGWGRGLTVADIVSAAGAAEVLLVGEEHGDMPGHAFEAVLFEELVVAYGSRPERAGRTVVLSLEMFERDVQYVLDEYLAGLISEAHFLRSARPWPDYEERYRPLVEAAKRHGVPVVAANAPRRYVNRVTRDGPESLEELSELARGYLPPLPYPGPSDEYRAQWEAIMARAESQREDSVDAPTHSVPENAIHSQALWDASMGHAITSALVEHLGSLVVHVAGSFHVARGTGIPERIADYRPGTDVVTVVITKAEAVDAWDPEKHEGVADFVVLTTTDPKGGS